MGVRPVMLVLLASLALGACARRPLPAPVPPPDLAYARPSVPPSGSLWHSELPANYAFLDVRAHFPGDLLTVVISEQSQGKKGATTDAKAESSISASVEDFFGIPAAAVKILPSGFASRLHRREEERDEHADDRNHDEQLH